MRKLDAHVHIYERMNGYGCRGELRAMGNGVGRWANGDDHRLIPEGMGDTAFLAEDLLALMDRDGVEKAVILQGNLYGFQNEYIAETIRRYPDRLTGACAIDPFSRRGSEVFKYLLDSLGYKAAKFEFSDNCGLMSFHRPFALDGEIMRPYYQMLAQREATLVVDIGSRGMSSYQPETVARVARSYPMIRVIICHLLAPQPAQMEALSNELQALRINNVWFDLSALPWNTGPEKYPFPAARECVKLAKEIVGVEKLVWGSDAPGVLINTSYEQVCDYLYNSDVLTEAEKDAVFYTNALNVYRF